MVEKLEVKGETCPRPALITQNRLDELNPGDSLQVTADYPPARDNIERKCEKHGYETTVIESGEGDEFTLRIDIPEEAEESASET